jgi:hypothetical protein
LALIKDLSGSSLEDNPTGLSKWIKEQKSIVAGCFSFEPEQADNKIIAKKSKAHDFFIMI